MENTENTQNMTVRTGNSKVLMRIAGVLFALLAVVQIIYSTINYISRSDIYELYTPYEYYSNIGLAIGMILFSIACIIQKKRLFEVTSLILISAYLNKIIYFSIYGYSLATAKLWDGQYILFYYLEYSTENYIISYLIKYISILISFIIIFMLFIAQTRNKSKLIIIGKCTFAIPFIAYIVINYRYAIELPDHLEFYIRYGNFSVEMLLDYFQQILLIAGIFILSLSMIITPKKLNVPASSTAYGKSYKSLVPHVLLLLFTCGIYYLVWIYRTTDSLNACKNEEYRTPINKLLLCMFVPFYSIYWTYKSAHRIDMLGYEKGILGETATLSLILSLFVPILPPILMQSKLNSVIMADSASPAVATAMQYAAKPVDNGYNDLQYAAKPADNGYNDLEKLKELYDKGVITEEEFTEKKKQVLGI